MSPGLLEKVWTSLVAGLLCCRASNAFGIMLVSVVVTVLILPYEVTRINV